MTERHIFGIGDYQTIINGIWLPPCILLPTCGTFKHSVGWPAPFPFGDRPTIPSFLFPFVVCPTFQLISLLFDLPRSAAATAHSAEAKTLSMAVLI